MYNVLMFNNLIAIFIGGGIGAVLRYIATLLCQRFCGSALWGTFGVNILGCFLIGFLAGMIFNKTDLISPMLRLFVAVGILGGLTTFSTFNLEIFELFKSGKVSLAFLYLFGSCFLGLLFTTLGYYLSKLA